MTYEQAEMLAAFTGGQVVGRVGPEDLPNPMTAAEFNTLGECGLRLRGRVERDAAKAFAMAVQFAAPAPYNDPARRA